MNFIFLVILLTVLVSRPRDVGVVSVASVNATSVHHISLVNQAFKFGLLGLSRNG